MGMVYLKDCQYNDVSGFNLSFIRIALNEVEKHDNAFTYIAQL